MIGPCAKLTRIQARDIYFSVLRDCDEHAIRRLCREDLFFLLVVACKRIDIDRDWLYARCREVEAAPDGYLDLWAREHYKDLDCNTPVLTTDGWKRHGDLVTGDKVFTPSGKTASVVATKHFNDSECRRVEFRGGASLVAGAGHLWGVEVWSAKRVDGEKREGWVDRVARTDDLLSGYKCPRIKLPEFSADGRTRLHPYVLGAWLGDGDTLAGRVCGQDEEVFSEIEKAGFVLSHSHCPKRAPFRSVTVYGLSQELRKLGVLGNKHVPHQFLVAGEWDRLALLQGLMDTDGSQSSGRNSHATFCNTNENLAKAVLTLACSLGFKARMTPARTTGSWQVCFQTSKSDKHCPFRVKRKADARSSRERNEASGHWYVQSVNKVDTRPTNCIQIDDPSGMYLAGRQLIPTHNSTIITFGLTIQDILRDSNITVGIFSHTRPIAKAFLVQIKREFETNTFLKDMFPDVLYARPEKESPQWSIDGGIIVKRTANPKEGTVEAWGLVDGQPTSKHYRLLVYDDVVTRESVTTPEQIEKTTEALGLSYNLGADGGARRFIGTRYHFNDTYRTVLERMTATPRLHPATSDGTLEGAPVLLDRAKLNEKRRDMGPYVFGCQMLQNPIADKAMGFREEWLRYYTALSNHAHWNYYICVDPAHAKKKDSDYTVMIVWGLGFDNNLYLVDAIRDRMNLTERTSTLFRLVRKWKPIRTGYERYGLQADIEHIKDVQARENYRFEIVEVAGQMAKPDRIRRLVPWFEQGRVFLPNRLMFKDHEDQVRDFTREFRDEEYLAFPVSIHDDALDCASRILDDEVMAQFPREQRGVLPAVMRRDHAKARTEYDVLATGG